MVWGYAILVLSIIFNAGRYNLESAAMKIRSASTAPISVWAVLVVGSYTAAAALLVTGWIWRRMGWTLGTLQRISPASCLEAVFAQGWLVLLATLGGSAGGWFLVQSNKLYGPEFTAFLGNLMPVLLVLTGLFSGERLRRWEFAAITFTITGAFVFSYQHGRINWTGLGLMVVGCMFMVMKKSLMKVATGVGHLPSVMTLATLLMGTWELVGGVVTGGLHFGSPAGIGLVVTGGLLGAMVGMSLLYAGLNIVGLARGAPIDSLRPLAVLIIGMITGTALPAKLQLVGGAMVLLGSAALARMGTTRSSAKKGAAPAEAGAVPDTPFPKNHTLGILRVPPRPGPIR